MQLDMRGTSLALECLLIWIGLLVEYHFPSQFVWKGMSCGRSQQCSGLQSKLVVSCYYITPPKTTSEHVMSPSVIFVAREALAIVEAG